MKVIKQFICLLVCFVLLSSSFMIGYAVDDGDYEPVFPLPEDLIDMGFSEDEDGNYIYTEDDDPFDFGFNWFISNEKNYPDFNPVTDIPWSTFPQYIQDIIYMSTDDLSKSSGSFNVPFVAVFVEDSTFNLFVGVNVGFGQINNSYLSFSIFSYVPQTIISSSSVLHRLSYNYKTDSVNLNWSKQNPASFGDNGNLKRMITWNIGSDASVFDIYCFGANGVYYPLMEYVDGQGNHLSYEAITHLSIQYNSSNSSALCSFSLSPDGFRSGKFLYGQDTAYPYCYFEYFVPPSQESINQQLQQEQNETSKGIWETLKSALEYIKHLPSNIASSIKEFFTTLGDRISGFFTNLGDRISDFFTTLKNYILYFQAEEPDLNDGWGYSNFLTDLRDYVYEMKKNLTDFNNSLDTTFESIESYITTGSDVINRLLSGVPILNTVLIFFLIFAVVRKAVGR